MKTSKIGLDESLDFYNKKAPQKVLSQKWCAILCDYRTQISEELKEKLQNFCLEFGNTKLYTLFHENEKTKRITTKIAPKNN